MPKNYIVIFDNLWADIRTRFFFNFSDSGELKTIWLIKGCGSQSYTRCGAQLPETFVFWTPRRIFQNMPLLGALKDFFPKGKTPLLDGWYLFSGDGLHSPSFSTLHLPQEADCMDQSHPLWLPVGFGQWEAPAVGRKEGRRVRLGIYSQTSSAGWLKMAASFPEGHSSSTFCTVSLISRF